MAGMRYPKDQKQATMQRILEPAGRRFKADGIDGAGVAAVMSDAGLTNGAFYAHFASKEDLVANVLAEQLRVQRESFRAAPSDRAGLELLIRAYLSPEHRDQSADGCPSAALLDEIVRRPASTRLSSPTKSSPPPTTSRPGWSRRTPTRREPTRSRSWDS
jgi:TetR/AcrR family transcriptional regulator, transcriptional repressor for nem operon